MKSTKEQLENRGFITDGSIKEYKFKTNHELNELLKNKNAVMRSIAAKIMGERKEPDSLPLLCKALKNETKLYTKIAICEAIECYGITALDYLLPLFGKIGNNRHKKIDVIDIKKKSFPLPRDIIARIIIRIGPSALPFLENTIENGNYEQMIEALDAVGHIAFYHSDCRSLPLLLNLFKKSSDEFLKWKLIRTFQSFNGEKLESILDEIIRTSQNRIFIEEAKRSLERINKRKK
jgi:hypothetical protein